MERFKQELARLKRSKRLIRWGESREFSAELHGLLDELKRSVDDPQTGAELVIKLYEADQKLLGRCDDSSGYVGDFFRYSARDLFVDYASRAPGKKRLAGLVVKLIQKDNFGVRDALVDCAAEYLPEDIVREMVASFQASADALIERYDKMGFLSLVSSLARQLKDAPLFEQATLATFSEGSTSGLVDIATVYWETGNARTALSWLERFGPTDTWKSIERNRLLLDIYKDLDEPTKQAEVAWRIFESGRGIQTFEQLLSIIGPEKRESTLADQVTVILNLERWSYADVLFLAELEQFDAVAQFILTRHNDLDGGYSYNHMLSLAQSLEKAGHHLAVTAIYRALLDSILERAKTQTYSHGVRYLKKLDALVPSISDWQHLVDHTAYMLQIRQQHGRKHSFWGRYEK